MNNLISITLDKETWTGILFHFQDTVENIPVSLIEPDPWICVTKAIEAIESKFQEDEATN